LWVGHDGNAADIFKIRGRHIDLGSEIFCSRGSDVAIGNGEVREPVRGSAGLAVGSRRDSADELLAILDVPVIVSGVFVLLHDVPAKEVGIELTGARLIGRAQVRPAESAVRSGDACAGIFVGLPQGEYRAGGILQDGHATGIENIRGRSQNLAAKLFGAGGSGVGAFDGDVQIPVWRNAVGEFVGTKFVASCGVAPFELEYGVNLVRADGHVLGGPAEDLKIEIRGGGLVGGAEFDPAKFAGSVFFDVRHNAGSVLPGRDGGKRVVGVVQTEG
jgi:hypothetical protein